MTSLSMLRFGKELSELRPTDIQQLINNRIDESQNLEYKQPTDNLEKDCDNLSEITSSFLNTDGGLIIFGVSEIKDKEHRIASQIKWCTVTKERLENLLVSRIQPWEERIKIHRIENETNTQEGIFVIEVPKSNNPPHMYNSIYYQRLNFQSKPMQHEAIFRVFQTSWIRRNEIIKQIIEPLYSEITEICERLRIFQSTVPRKYDHLKLHERYLYDQLSVALRNEIDDFYKRIKKLQLMLDWQAYKIASKIVDEQLATMLPEKKNQIFENQDIETLKLNVKVKDASGTVEKKKNIEVYWALPRREPLCDYLQSLYPHYTILDYEPFFTKGSISMQRSEFEELWKRSEESAKKNVTFIGIWAEIDELLKLGSAILMRISL